MRVGRVTSKVMRIFLVCLVVGVALGWFPSIVNASSTTQLSDISTNYNSAQTRASEALPIASQPVSSPAAGTWEVTGTIQLSGTERPLQIAISGGKAYVSRNPGHLTVVDLSTNTVVTTISFSPYPGATPHHIGISGGKAYVALSNLGSDGQLAVINTADNTVSAYIPVGADPYGVATFGQRVYVTNNVWWSSGDPATVKVVDTNTNSVVATIPVGINPTSVAVDPVSNKAYVANHNDLSKSVSVIDTTSNLVTTTIPINNPPAGVAISGTQAYIATTVNMPNGTVEVIDIGSDSIVSSIPVGRDSWGIATSDDHVFVANQSSSTVSVIEVATNSVVATVNVGDDPTGIAVDPSTNGVYVTNQGDNTISIIEFREAAQPANQPPTVSITSPSNNAAISGIINVQGTASDPDGSSQLQMVEVKIDTGSWGQASGTTSWSYSWDTTIVPDGQHSIYARSYDGQVYSSEESIVVSVNNVAPTPSLVDVGISSEAEAWPPKTFLQAKPGDRINTWYRISYAGYLVRVKLKTTIFDPSDREIGNPLNDPFLQIDGPTEDTGWVGVTFEIPDEAILGTYDVGFSVWSEDGAQEYDALMKPGWLSLDSDIHTGTIEVTSDPSGASFTLSGPANYSGITPWSKADTPVGTYTITWGVMSGYQTPPQESKTLVQGGAIYFHVPYQSGKGTIEVTSDPSGASFTLSGPADYSGITPWSKTDAPVGTYTIIWAPISGYQTPPQESKILTQGGTISFYGPYRLGKGTIEVTSEPSGASFTLSGPADYSGTTPWSKTDTPVGTYTITWNPISGYETPPQESKTLTQGGMVSFYGSYESSKGAIEVTSDPSGASFTLSGPANYSGTTPWSKTDAPVGTYTITWGFMSGYETPPQESKTLTQGGMVSFRSGYITPSPPTISARIDSYSPSSLVEVTVGGLTTISVTFTNNGNNAWNFIAGATVWDSGGNQVANYSKTLSTALQPGQQTTVSWTHHVNQAGDYLLQFGIWKGKPYTSENLLDKRPSPYQKLITGHIPPSVDQYTLTISHNPRGEITLSPKEEHFEIVISPDTGAVEAGIFHYRAGTRVTLTAEPIAGYEFSHWGGDVAGIKNPSTIMMNSDIRIIAYFIHESVAGGTQVANLEGNELSLLGKAIRETVTQISSPETDNERKKWLSLTQELVRKIESGENVRNVIREKTETQELFVSFAAGLGGVLAQWATHGIVPQYLAAYAFKLAGDMAAITAEKWLLRDFGAVEVQEKGVGTLYAMYDRQQGKVLVHVDLFDYPGGRILMEIPLQPVLVDSPGTGNIVLVKELIPDLQGVWFSYPTVRMLKVEVESPVELMVYDSERHVTGITNGEVRNEIPSSTFSEEAVIILCLPDSSIDFYQYEVIGTDKGSYSLAVTSIVEESAISFTITDTPVSTKMVHQYTIDWGALSEGEKGVTMEIDSDGDGTFEDIKYLGREGMGFSWVWVALAGLSGLVGVLVGAFMVRRRMGKKEVPKG